MQQAQQKNGIKAAYLAKDLTVDFGNNQVQDSFFSYNRPSFIAKIKNKFNPSDELKFSQELGLLRPKLNCEMASLPFAQVDILEHPLVQEADIIHLHWVVDMVSYSNFFKNCKKPIVWTLHDMNPFLGLFHYMHDSEINKEAAAPLEQQIRDIKKQALKAFTLGAVVSPSAWLLTAAKASQVFNNSLLFKDIANTIDTNLYCPEQNSTSHPEALTLLYTAGNLENPRKGVDLVVDALNDYKEPITLLTIGKGELNITNPLVNIEPLGYISDPKNMVAIYQKAHALLLPSREDNLPNTMVESLCCGTPVISFKTGGMQEYIVEAENGCLSSCISGQGLHDSISRFAKIKSVFNATAIATQAKAHFQEKNQAKKYLNLYLELYNLTNPKN